MPIIQWYPGHMTKARRELAAIMPAQDFVIEVVDARLPGASANPLLAELRKEKPCLKVLSKSDLADEAMTAEWMEWLGRQRGVTAVALRSDRAAETRAQIAELSKRLSQKKPIRALIAGVPNVGKSTLINTLMSRTVAAVSDKPAVTKAQQQVVLPSGMVLHDSPGITWPKIEDEDAALRLALAGSIPDTAIDYLTVGLFAARVLRERWGDRVRARFKIEALPEPPDEILAAIGKRRGCLKKGGGIDMHKAAELLVHAFRAGDLGRITLESPPIEAEIAAEQPEPDDGDLGD